MTDVRKDSAGRSWLRGKPRTGLLAALRNSPPAVRRLLIAAAVDSAGTGLFLSSSAVFFTRFSHLSVEQVGAGLSAGALAGLLGTVPVGYVADRFSPRNVLIAICLWRAACFGAYVFVRSFPLFVVIAVCQGVGERGAAPVRQSIIAGATGEEHKVTAAALLRTAQNASFTAGAAIATAALVTASRDAFVAIALGDAASFLAAATAVLGIPSGPGASTPGAAGHEVSRRASAPLRGLRALTGGMHDRRFVTLSGLNGLLALHNSLLVVGIPLWIVATGRLPVAVVPALTLLNTVLVVVLQVLVASAARTIRDSGRCMLAAGAALLTSCVLIAVMTGPVSTGITITILTVAVIAQTVAELYRSAGGWKIALTYAQGDTASRYLAVFSLGTAAEALTGPALFADAIIPSGIAGWLILAAVFGLAGAAASALTAGPAGIAHPRVPAE